MIKLIGIVTGVLLLLPLFTGDGKLTTVCEV